MSNVKFQLNLNKHPKDCPNYSLVNAKNVRVSDDFSCLQSEESIIGNPTINEYIEDNEISIISIIPCNKELVIFANENSNENVAHILRYNENDDIIVDLYQNLNYEGGNIIGTFTYNVNNELIVAFSEYSDNGAIPLKTINLGVWDGDNTTSDELDFEDGKLALSPEVIIPEVSNFSYVPGTSYKGWYYYFIRYKINKNDYTRWFPIGYPIFVTTLELKNIFKYGLNNGTRTENPTSISSNYILNGISDYFSSKDDACDESVLLTISNIDSKYDYFQLGFCCISKTYSKAFRTSDIDTPIGVTYNYTMNISNCIEYTVNDLILNNYNYYNVKNIINYKNRLYISNYKENNNPIISEEELGKIRLLVSKSSGQYLQDVKYKDLASNTEYNKDDIESDDFIVANPILTIIDIGSNAHTVQIRSEQHTDEIFHSYDLSNCFITTNNGNKIYGIPIYGRQHIRLGYDYYSEVNIVFSINGINYILYGRLIQDETYDIFEVTDAASFNAQIPVKQIFPYINTNNSFNERKKESTLIPGEIYNFYIHFVNKYGESTQGYRIPNTVKFKIEGSDEEYFPVCVDGSDYLLVPLNNRIFDDDGNFIVTGLEVKKGFLRNSAVYDYDNQTNTYTFSHEADITLADAKSMLNLRNDIAGVNNNLKWYELFSTNLKPSNGSPNRIIPFSYYKNNNNDTLFKVPDSRFETIENSEDIIFNYCSFYFDLSNFTIPDGYIGYYFSYEKFESQNKIDGILTKYDTFDQGSLGNNYKKYNNEAIINIKEGIFYSSKLDISDNLDLDCNILRIQKIEQLSNSDSISSYSIDSISLLSKQYPINYNNIEFPYRNNAAYGYTYIPINDIQLRKAGSITDGRFGVGTALSMPLSQEQLTYLFYNKNFVKASLIKINRNIYTNENKILIKFTNVFYTEINGTISRGLNGHVTYQGTLIYNYNKFIMSAENIILTEQYKPYYRCPVYKGLWDKRLGQNRPPIAYIEQVCYSDTFYEAKSFKNEPEVLFQNLEEIKADIEEQVMPFAANSIVTPANSIDLFQELQTNQDLLNPKTYLANSASRSYITQFDKRVQRSNVIADESLINSWRTFPLEGYKDISENKGRITNLIGIGTTLLVHTEHSLFAFDGNNTLKTGDGQDIRLTLPDIFDIDYTEVFTSDLGVCGLQDKEACVVGQFGYIFYDNDAHRFYKFSSKKIEFIDFDIVQYINTMIPYNVRFAHDIERNRILIAFKVFDRQYNNQAEVREYTLSYNYQLGKFISLHTYKFDKAFNTKTTLYLLYNNGLYCNIHDLNHFLDVSEGYDNFKLQRRRYTYNNENYGHFDNGASISPMISIIVNDSYSLIKTIEFLTYKLFKRIDDNTQESIISDFHNERELSRVPYSGFKLRIHNDLCDSGEIDVSIDNESVKNLLANYNKPWWEYGNWNFNYFRDTKQGTSSHDIMSRIYGNYFIIDIIFYNNENPYPQKIEFEGLDVKVITDETV